MIRKELDIYSSVIFDTHKESINEFCKDMGADFEIDDFKPIKKIVGKGERIFAIKFFGSHKVSVKNEDERTPNFRNTLSESDKRLLAFAFFVSLLSHDRELEKRIVVFDDPMSSFDSERRRKTVHLIADIACKYSEVDGIEKRLTPRQKIILTHEDRFAKELKRLIPSAKTLKIEECSVDGQRGSKISYADFEQEFPDVGISNRVEAIRRILNERTFAIPFEAECRVILEHIFRRKYGLELKDEIGSRKSIRTFTTKLSQEEVNGFEDTIKFQKFIRLCDDLNIELHDNGSVTSNGDKELVLRDFFECLKIV